MAIWVFWVVGFVFAIGFAGLLSLMTSNFPVTPERMHYGRHRQSGTSLYSGTTNKSDISTGGAYAPDTGEDDAAAISPRGATRPGALIPLSGVNSMMAHHALNPPGHFGVGAPPSTQAQILQAQAMAQQFLAYGYAQQNIFAQQFTGGIYIGGVASHAKTFLKSDGVRAGEIIAWRAWLIDGDNLRSASVSSTWDAKEPMRGDAAAGYGVHAYKSPHGPMLDGYADTGQSGAWVIGEVALWGDVIEHERGYRAEFGRVHSLVTWSRAVPAGTRDRIRSRYLPEPTTNQDGT